MQRRDLKMRKYGLIIFCLIACLFVLTPHVFAAGTTTTGASANDFVDIYDKFVDWTAGSLGKAIALAMFLLGLGVGVMRQSPLPAVSGIVAAMFVAYGPKILSDIATAVF